MLRYDPNKRLTAREALKHNWFEQDPLPTPPEMFPTWPAKSELGKAAPVANSPTKAAVVAKDVSFIYCYARNVQSLVISLGNIFQ